MNYETHDPDTVESRIASGESLESILSDSEYQTEWTNHWDVNPGKHGGCFVRFDGDMWEVIVTTPPSTFPDDCSENEHLFEKFYIEPGYDVWDIDELREACENAPEALESDPYAGFTDETRKLVGQYSHGGPDSSIDLPAVKALMFDFHSYYGGYEFAANENWVHSTEYWETLEATGVDIDRWKPETNPI